MLETGPLFALSCLGCKCRSSGYRSTSEQFPHRTVAGHDRDIVNPSLRIASEAEAVRELVSLIEARRAYLRRCGGFRTGWDPIIDLLCDMSNGDPFDLIETDLIALAIVDAEQSSWRHARNTRRTLRRGTLW